MAKSQWPVVMDKLSSSERSQKIGPCSRIDFVVNGATTWMIDSYTIYHGRWIGLYIDGDENHALILQCVTIGTHPRFLGNGNPTREMVGFFHEVKILYTTTRPKKESKKKKK